MRTTAARALAASLAVAIAPIAARAQPSPPPPPAAPPAPPSRPIPSAIARVADALARDLARSPARALVVSAPLVSDTPAPRAAQLAATLAAQVAGRRGAAWHARAEPAALAAARVAARGDTALVHLTVEIAAGALRVSADVYPVPRSVWARIRNAEPGPVAHAFAQAPIDAEVRSYLAPVGIVTASVDRGRNFEGDVVAVACGDLDLDGAPEIVAVSRRRVSTVRIRSGKVIPLLSRNWPDLAPVAPAPLREPIGFASIAYAPPGAALGAFVDVGLTDRMKSVRLDGELKVASSFGGIAVPDGDASACTRVGGLVVTGALGACAPGDPPPFSSSVGGQYDAFASARLVSPRGEPYLVWAGRERGALELRDDAGHKAGEASVGAQIAVGDLDQDGDPEIITSLDTLNPAEDAVVVRSWSRVAVSPAQPAVTPRLREVLRFPVASGVRAIAVCPPDGPGRAPFVVATTDEILVVR